MNGNEKDVMSALNRVVFKMNSELNNAHLELDSYGIPREGPSKEIYSAMYRIHLLASRLKRERFWTIIKGWFGGGSDKGNTQSPDGGLPPLQEEVLPKIPGVGTKGTG